MNNEMINKPPFKVKCIDIERPSPSPYLTVGKEYDVAEVKEGFYKVKNDICRTQWYYDSRFEIVETPPEDKQEFSVGDKVVINKISSSYVLSVDKNVKVGDVATVENILDSDVELSNPNWKREWWFFKADVSLAGIDSITKPFKVGDKVYKYGETDVKTVLEVFEYGYMQISNYPHSAINVTICYATQENYEMLCKLYPHIEFEQPPKEITGSDLCRAMLDKGWNLVPCVVSDISDSDALNNDNCCLVDEWWVGSFDSCFNSGDYSYKYAVPFDPKTGIPLTEDVLNEKI